MSPASTLGFILESFTLSCLACFFEISRSLASVICCSDISFLGKALLYPCLSITLPGGMFDAEWTWLYILKAVCLKLFLGHLLHMQLLSWFCPMASRSTLLDSLVGGMERF